jgi:hypothetical protein
VLVSFYIFSSPVALSVLLCQGEDINNNMCGGDKSDSNPSWMGWAEFAIDAPSGPIPRDWPSAAKMKALLQAAAKQWDSGGLQPPSRHGLLLPPGYGDNGTETTDEAVERLCLDWRKNLWNIGERNQPDMHPTAEEDLQKL